VKNIRVRTYKNEENIRNEQNGNSEEIIAREKINK
jgi:hypothetical protein